MSDEQWMMEEGYRMMGEGKQIRGDDVLLPFLKPAAAAAINYPRN